MPGLDRLKTYMKKILLLLALVAMNEAVAQVVFGRDQNNPSGGVSINYSSPKEYEIADIEVRGVQFLDNNALISLSGLRVGDKIKVPGDEITTAIKKLWRQGIIGNVTIFASKVEGDKIWLVIELTERPRLTKYTIEGVNKTKKGEIEDKVGLIRGKVLTDVVIKNTELAVTKYMESKGYLNAKVRVVQQNDTVLRNSAYLKITIDKGQKVKIRNIRFDGNEQFTSAKLRSKFKGTGMVPKFSLPTEIIETTAKLMWPPNFVNFVKGSKKVSKEEVREYMATHVNLQLFQIFQVCKGRI